MSFEAFTPGQDDAARKILEGSTLEGVGFGDEGIEKSETGHEARRGSTESNPFSKQGSGSYEEDEQGRKIIGEEEANKAKKWLEEKGSNTEGWKLE
ncbi:MAG: hypothetical protein A2481_04470 [Candidatus Yonathbacteria bacterium RIFOXYC2_FULL_47_9]|nr:MAG: hypothetical protein A2481_04470 [Candidatus Yonathbacteria bacterium RIFOXYC2_FULL_47_9]HAT68282.1 hypothetical protein [Candidatus Yonathbacteria bacterium]